MSRAHTAIDNLQPDNTGFVMKCGRCGASLPAAKDSVNHVRACYSQPPKATSNRGVSDESIIESLSEWQREDPDWLSFELKRQRLFQRLPKGLLPLNIRACDKCGCSLKLRFRKPIELYEAICRGAHAQATNVGHRIALKPFQSFASTLATRFAIHLPPDVSDLTDEQRWAIFRMPQMRAAGQGDSTIGEPWDPTRPELPRCVEDLDENERAWIAAWFSQLATQFPLTPDDAGEDTDQSPHMDEPDNIEPEHQSAAHLLKETEPDEVHVEHLTIMNEIRNRLSSCAFSHFHTQVSESVQCMRKTCDWTSYDLFKSWPTRYESLRWNDAKSQYHESIHFSKWINVELLQGDRRVDLVTIKNPFRYDLEFRLEDLGVPIDTLRWSPHRSITEAYWTKYKIPLELFFTDVENLESCYIEIKDARAFKVLKEIRLLEEALEDYLRRVSEAEDFNSAVGRDALFVREHGIYPDDI